MRLTNTMFTPLRVVLYGPLAFGSPFPRLAAGEYYLTDESGNYLTDENGNYLIGKDS